MHAAQGRSCLFLVASERVDGTVTHSSPGAPCRTRVFADWAGACAACGAIVAWVLQTLLRDVILGDVAARHGLREARHVMTLALFLLANTG